MRCWYLLSAGLASILVALLAISVAGWPMDAQAESAIIMPVRSIDLGSVQACYHDLHSSGFCDRCKSPNIDNISLTNYVLLRETLKAGGMDVRPVAIASPNSPRSRKMVETGMATIKTDWSFNIDHNDQVLKSDAFIRQGEFFKGIYGLPDNPLLQNVHDLADLRLLSATSNPRWRLDWQVLSRMKLANLFPASRIAQMYSLIELRRADFTLLEFAVGPDMVREVHGVKLAPVAGVKVVLPGSQHFMVSRKDPRAEKLIAVLNRGLKVLRENGLLAQCLRQGGLINARTAHWKVLNVGENGISEHHNFDVAENHR